MPEFTQHIFVCCNRRQPGHQRGCCDAAGSERLRNALKAEVKSRNLGPLVRVNKAGCLDQCELGPTFDVPATVQWWKAFRWKSGRVLLSLVPDVRAES